MTIAMPGVVLQPRLFDCGFEPVASIQQPVSLCIQKDVAFSAPLLFEGSKRRLRSEALCPGQSVGKRDRVRRRAEFRICTGDRIG